MIMESSTNSDDPSDDNSVTLETNWLYQNPTTGTPSRHPLTTRQICFFVEGFKSAVLTAETQILKMLPDGSYATAWQMARNVPIVRYVIEQWYYESVSTKGESPKVEGPVCCRELAELFYRDNDDSLVRPTTRVYSQFTKEWKAIQDDAELQMALEAFYANKNHKSALGSQKSGTVDPALVDNNNNQTEAQKELEAFLSSTAGPNRGSDDDDDDDDDASYESDHGTRYVKDHRTGKWIHEALAPPSSSRKDKGQRHTTATTDDTTTTTLQPKKKKQKKAQFAARNARCWIYITGLPMDTTEEQLAQVFSKAGILDLDPATQRPKIKIYRHTTADDHPTLTGQCKGDASLCYARPESVELAMTLLDETEFQKGLVMKVQPAQFEQRGELDGNRNRVSNAQRKVAKLAALQARDWDESNGRLVGGRKGLRIIVLKHLFAPHMWNHNDESQEIVFFSTLERELRAELEKFGVVEKITVFSKRVDGVGVIKFAQPSAASEAVKDWDGKFWKGRRIEAIYWDGVTDFTVVQDEHKEKEEADKRLEEFGNWLDEQELPEELQLQTE